MEGQGLVVLCVFYALLAALVTGVSALTIAVFSRKKLRRRQTSFLLIGLAVADLLIGTLVLPLFITVTLTRPPLHVFYVSYYSDIITGLASIFTLAVISLERMFAICFPFRHQKLSRCAYIDAACVPWILVIGGIIVMLLVKDRHFNNVFFISSLVLPLVIICISYSAIWVKRHRSPLQQDQERKLARTLLIIIGAFVVTWLPFQVTNTYIVACSYSDSCKYPPVEVLYIAVFLRLSNSFVNFMVYSLRMPNFKEQLRKLFTTRGRQLPGGAAIDEVRELEVKEDGRQRDSESQTVNFELTQL